MTVVGRLTAVKVGGGADPPPTGIAVDPMTTKEVTEDG
jgi:hypothetical protein